MFVRDIMEREVVSVSGSSSVKDAAKKMRDNNVGTLAVLDDGRLIGLLNDRQIALKVIATGSDPDTMQVSEIMTRDPVTCPPDTDLFRASEIMGSRHFRRLPIVDKDNKLRGIVSITDIGQALKCCLDNVFDEPCKREKGISVGLKG